MIEVDGSAGEGGGAVLRNALAISAATGQPVRVRNIRANRTGPGLKHQHLAGALAIAEICGARASGLSLGSTEVAFEPGPVKAGEFAFDVGTAGSVTLVLQTLLPALAFAPSEVRLRISGGTDVPWSPPADYFGLVLFPLLARMGLQAEIRILKRGFYPKGGGEIEARFAPAGSLLPLALSERGGLRAIRGVSVAGSLPANVAERQAAAAERLLAADGFERHIARETCVTPSPGSSLVLAAEFEGGALGASSLGARGKPAERVGEEAAMELSAALRSGAGIDAHAADQLLAFCFLAQGESRFTTPLWSSHAETNAAVARQFINREINVERAGGLARVRIL